MNIAIIPAKGHSSRVQGKNKRYFHGKPIIAYSIETAKKSRLFSSIIVSTDDEEIAEIAQKYGADVMIRPKVLCEDQYGPLDVARHCVKLITPAPAKVAIIYATAPMLTVEALVRGYRELDRHGMVYAVSIGVEPLHDAAQFFWAHTWGLLNKVPEFAEQTVMVPVDWRTDCDINTEKDWLKAETMYEMLPEELC